MLLSLYFGHSVRHFDLSTGDGDLLWPWPLELPHHLLCGNLSHSFFEAIKFEKILNLRSEVNWLLWNVCLDVNCIQRHLLWKSYSWSFLLLWPWDVWIEWQMSERQRRRRKRRRRIPMQLSSWLHRHQMWDRDKDRDRSVASSLIKLPLTESINANI